VLTVLPSWFSTRSATATIAPSTTRSSPLSPRPCAARPPHGFRHQPSALPLSALPGHATRPGHYRLPPMHRPHGIHQLSPFTCRPPQDLHPSWHLAQRHRPAPARPRRLPRIIAAQRCQPAPAPLHTPATDARLPGAAKAALPGQPHQQSFRSTGDTGSLHCRPPTATALDRPTPTRTQRSTPTPSPSPQPGSTLPTPPGRNNCKTTTRHTAGHLR
jgi:hypothetical protein